MVLSGFRFRTTDLGRCPDIDSLRTDPVYQPFVATGWQNAEARAEAEWERAQAESERAQTEWKRAQAESEKAEAERQRAKDQQQRADRLAAQLRALGIDPDTFG